MLNQNFFFDFQILIGRQKSNFKSQRCKKKKIEKRSKLTARLSCVKSERADDRAFDSRSTHALRQTFFFSAILMAA